MLRYEYDSFVGGWLNLFHNLGEVAGFIDTEALWSGSFEVNQSPRMED